MCAGCVRVFLVLMTVQADEFVHVSKLDPGSETRPGHQCPAGGVLLFGGLHLR